MTLDEEETSLVRQFLKSKSETLFRSLYRAHTPHLFRIALRLSNGHTSSAEDLTQETWERAISRLHAFKSESSLRSWLIGILINCSREHAKKQSHDALSEEQAEMLASASDDVARTLDLKSALAVLPEGYRTVLILHDFEGYKHHEIGAMLGINEGTSKSQLFNARNVIRKLIGSTT